ncbi:hypothetical protein PGT21_011607 [Puccinia graminis f. sp. tritici]|uniref:Uncharacterized protein n=1 Tax=Puccinia graminis f. sp. tritici TaxID=56615 RepID=A0A5B0Q556_PUCGR|nr:hypothetical protein PGT21_011607 [Puccinia graminis f. sp. tritici]
MCRPLVFVGSSSPSSTTKNRDKSSHSARPVFHTPNPSLSQSLSASGFHRRLQ